MSLLSARKGLGAMWWRAICLKQVICRGRSGTVVAIGRTNPQLALCCASIAKVTCNE